MRCGHRTRRWWRACLIAVIALAPCGLPARAIDPVCPDAVTQALHLPATRQAVSLGQPVVIVAFGSSSTEGAGASLPANTYPARLHAGLQAAWPSVSVTVLNRGKGGQDTAEMLARLDTDVLAAAPTLVIWQTGGNAALRDLDPDRFAELTHQGVQAIVARGADLVLMDNQVAPRILRAPRHALYGEILMREAVSSGVSLFSRTGLMRDWAAAEPHGPAMIAADELHHTDRGYACLAQAIGQAIVAATAPEANRPTTRRR